MKELQPGNTDQAIDLLHQLLVTLQGTDIVAGSKGMAGVQTEAKTPAVETLKRPGQLLQGGTERGSLAGSILQQDDYLSAGLPANLLKTPAQGRQTSRNPFSLVGPGMDDEGLNPQPPTALQLIQTGDD